MVALVKYPLRRVAGKKRLSLEELTTLLIEIERICNERPLTYISEAENNRPIRPIDFLIPYPLVTADPELERVDLDDPEFQVNRSSHDKLVDQYKISLELANQFWDEWISHYLIALREKSRSEAKPNASQLPLVGELVIIYDNELHRSQWRIGKIEELVASKDGKCRTAKVKVGPKNIWTRALKHLYPLECREDVRKLNITDKNEENTENVISASITMTEEIELEDQEDYGVLVIDEQPGVREFRSIESSRKRKHSPIRPPTGKDNRSAPLGVESLDEWDLHVSCEGNKHKECLQVKIWDIIKKTKRNEGEIRLALSELKEVKLTTMAQLMVATALLNNGKHWKDAIQFIVESQKYQDSNLFKQLENKSILIGNQYSVRRTPVLHHLTPTQVQDIIDLRQRTCVVAGRELDQSNRPIILSMMSAGIANDLSKKLSEGLNKYRCRERKYVNTPIVFIGDQNASKICVAWGRAYIVQVELQEMAQTVEQGIFCGSKVSTFIIINGADWLNYGCSDMEVFQQQFIKVIRYCKERGIQVVICHPPVVENNLDGWEKAAVATGKLKE